MIMRDTRGISLLLSLFVLSAILVTALSAGTLIVRELKITGAGVRGVQAFYVAESGLEDALYEFRQKGNTNLDVSQNNPETISNGAWWRSYTKTVGSEGIILTLLENQTFEVPLFDPDNTTDQADSITLTWDTDSASCPGGQYTWLEVVQSFWTLEAGNYVPRSERRLCSSSESSGCTEPITNSVTDKFPYLRVRALFNDACSLNLKAFNDTLTFDMPAQLQVKATGQVGDSQQALSITVPINAPQFGVFDYTIFSEQQICKEKDASSTFCDVP
ncbi:MAG: hypothetical protein UV57_C0016G0011 [Parcubacteria group bacterium GW2011_GWD2_43_10]|uniref:Type 4 fimbrial biogenesis protein PilX N-terminal domain-containing protein n=5 Tax=Candidatus Vebleniibacteriota TaxID=1817921 RepID=A0A1G2Q2S4_9BACT|nr:MAG: hypothetical protein UV47_C0006G0018 [Parcubacteria group bacterium GW2011_GWA2_42_80]KKS83364.1 MAG: hypothetical protein UV57_C0016G0011 [Parcubacteria group bacterium GW2011_GWD2_43_10]KKS93091.1 MAG: hypothetical protein UV69_C0014G0033 [Parcubacteria group bacterium GW2011_GWE2_43_12]KKT12226.1 MAG: hypothetical protein UV92_C0030G0008 [Parcubacteria group bacterium GW2011_GWA1_43_27]KKT16187.1 MAG: hypothetical protein UV96_C0001G0019 [Parcubacteria group bacterium GW2011_GWF2_43_